MHIFLCIRLVCFLFVSLIRKGEKNPNRRMEEVIFVPNPSLNFCETNLISVCSAAEKDKQSSCLFYDKSSFDDHCMFFHFKQFCNNPEAQRYARNFLKEYHPSGYGLMLEAST